MKRNPRPATCPTDEQTIVYPPAPAYSSAPPKAAFRAPATKPAAKAQSRETAAPPSSLFARYDEPSPNPTPKPTGQVIQTRCKPTRLPATYLGTGGWAFDEGQRAGDAPVITLQPTDPSSYRYAFLPSPSASNEPDTAGHVIQCPNQYDPFPDQNGASWWYQQTGESTVLRRGPYPTFLAPPTRPAPAATRDPTAHAKQPPPFPEDPFPTEPNAEVAMDENVGATLVALLKHMDERMSRIEERQDALGSAFSQQNQVIASLATTTPTRLPASPTFPALPANIPGTSIQPAAPAYPAPMMGGMYPTAYPQPGQGLPYERREVRRVVVNYPDGTKKTLAEAESFTKLDPRTGSETTELTDYRYTNRGGEIIDHKQQLWTCCECHDFTNNPMRCRVCGRPLCQQHAWVNTYEVAEDGNPQYRCRACVPPERGFWQQFFCGR